MMRRFAFALICIASLGVERIGAQSLPAVIPAPSEMRATGSTFILRNPVRIALPNASRRLREIADLLGAAIRSRTGFVVMVGANTGLGMITLDTSLTDANREAYSLEVKDASIVINGASSAGLLWGVQTLRQLLPPEFEDVRGARQLSWRIPGVIVRDAPKYRWRGSLVDVGRHFLQVEAVKKHVEMLSRYKMNVMHWHLTEDQGWRIEIKRYPRLTSVGAWRTEWDGERYGGFYTQDQIRDVVEFARTRGVDVVPEIEMPGHSSAAIASYPELGCTGEQIPVRTTWGVFADIYCAGKETTFEFLTNVLDEVVELFPSRYVHIGGDEAPKERWKECVPCQTLMRRENIPNEEALQAWFIRRIGDHLAKRGRQLIGWDEVMEGGLVAGGTVHAWRDTSYIRTAASAGYDVIASPSGWTYLNSSPRDLPIGRIYSFDPARGLDSASSQRVIGGEAAFWSEHITSWANFEMMAFPRVLALAEVFWGSSRDSASFMQRLESDHIPRLRAAGVVVGPTNREVARIGIEFDTTKRAARVRATGAPGVVIRGTSDGRQPTATSPIIADSTLLTTAGTHRLQAFSGFERLLEERRVVIVQNKATGAKTTVSPAPSRQYPGTGAGNLTDGLLGGADHADGLWQGWIGADMSAVVDLGAVQAMDTIRMTYLQNVRSWILFPARVEFAVSDDGETWRPVGDFVNRVAPEREGVLLQQFEALAPAGTRARYVRAIARNGGRLPAWHPGAGRPSWVFADEIVVK